jgi:hypothetical protein
MGLPSIMDAILEVSVHVLLKQLPADRETKGALLGQNRRLRRAIPTHAGSGILAVVSIGHTGEIIETD